MKEVLASYGQSIEDIAIQEYGCLEAVSIIMEDNGFSLDTELMPGQPIQIRDEVPELTENNKAVADYFKSNKVRPNSGVNPTGPDGEYVDNDYWDDDYTD